MFKPSRLGLTFAAVLLSSCTTLPSMAWSDDGPSEEGKLLGEYLAGSYAANIDDADARANYYSRAFSRVPDDVLLGSKAIQAALANGDNTAARAISIEMSGLDSTEPVSRLVLGASDMGKGNYRAAADRLHEQPSSAALGIMMAFIEGWAEFGDGNTQAALEVFDSIDDDGYFNVLGTLQKAKIYSALGDETQALAAFAIVEDSGLSRIQTYLAKAQFLDTLGKQSDALTYLSDFSAQLGGIETGPIHGAIKRLSAGKSLGGLPNAAQNASMSLIDPAGGIFAQQGAYNMAETYLRAALLMDADNDNARLWLGNILERMERYSEAEQAYKDIPKDSDYTVSSRLSHANLLFRVDEDDGAIAMLNKLYADHPARITRESLGTAYIIKEEYAKALPIYDALIASLSEEDLEQDTTPFYYRGICLEQLDRWSEAEADFKSVLAIEPDSADALNYLGYTWVDRGLNLPEAFDMIRRAVELEPNSGAIIDSLGWAHFKLGQYEEARGYLEEASEKSPGSATIIDHLGDVYWKLGRFREAGYQWERALDLDPTDKELAKIKVKLKDGYEAARDMP